MGFFLALFAVAILLCAGCEKKKAHDDPKDLWVLNTDPYTGETNVFINDPIVITFSSNVDTNTVNTSTIQISDPNGAIPPGRFEVHSNEVHFVPQFPPGLNPMMTYTVLIQGLPMTPVVMNTEATPLMQTYVFSFDTGTAARPDTTPPYVVSCNIPNGATGIPRDTNIQITFSEPIDTNSVSAGFSLSPSGGGTPIPGTLTMTNNTTILHFDPENGSFPGYLDANTEYQIQLTNAVRDMAGLALQDLANPLQDPPWSSTFTTSDQPMTASARGPFVEDFNNNQNEDAVNTTAEWNTLVPSSLVSTIFPTNLSVQDPGPATVNQATITEPLDPGPNTGGWRVASLILASEIAAKLSVPMNQLAGLPLTRLCLKAATGGPALQQSYTNLVVRVGLTT
ncbi:MAG: Ig-like domain-containing domain, partial [Planctomycetota bacterium]